jgi:succinate dehydrogenase/fumarate reductase flavoprotein subunit
MVDGASAGHAGHKTEGIWPADAECGTDMDGLFAAGDSLASMQCGAIYNCPGVSGAGSCAQGWVAGTRAAEYAKESRKPSISDRQIAQLKKEMFAPREREKGYGPAWITQVLQGIMIPYYVTMVKKEDRLNAALTNIEFLRDHFISNLRAANTHELRLAHDTQNMVENAEMKLRASLFRTESRGTHFREEYPFRDDENWLAWILIQNVNGRMELSKKPVPKKWWPDPSLPYEERYPEVRFPGELEALKSL